MRENGITLKESLQDHSNAAGYYSKKAKKMKDTPYISELKQEICKEIYSLNEVNKQNSKGSLEHSINDEKLKKNRDFIKKALTDPVKEKAPKPVKEKPVKEKAPKPVKEKPVKEKAPKPVKEKPVKEKAPKPVKEKTPKPVKEKTPKPVKEKPVKEKPVKEKRPKK
jgi:hypothetical protein